LVEKWYKENRWAGNMRFVSYKGFSIKHNVHKRYIKTIRNMENKSWLTPMQYVKSMVEHGFITSIDDMLFTTNIDIKSHVGYTA
jgi:hypothetical protein